MGPLLQGTKSAPAAFRAGLKPERDMWASAKHSDHTGQAANIRKRTVFGKATSSRPRATIHQRGARKARGESRDPGRRSIRRRQRGALPCQVTRRSSA